MSKVSKTIGPLHFEDLDPHRFEDLARELIYDYKDWQTIEATGRSGNDGGFDIRAYEKTTKTPQPESDEQSQEEIPPMEGNLWMIQVKREKEIGPKRIKEILTDVDSKIPPYGYILAASANFSKDSYDTFRGELRGKGVMEFYLWGKAELEDMLYLPKNDRILFTFFGISLVSKRRSRTTEIRQFVINKNKLYRILGEGPNLYKSVLLRDSKDTKYPYQKEYADFKEHPRWLEYIAVDYHPLGLIVNTSKHFAYFDADKKEYDYSEVADLINRESDSQEERVQQHETQDKVENYFENLPRRNQATYISNGLVRYDEMLIIDDKGDESYKFPHIFVDIDFHAGPIVGSYEYLKVGDAFQSLEGYKRVKKFPATFALSGIGTVYEKEGITLSNQLFDMLKNSNNLFFALYDCDGRYKYLKPRDAAPIKNEHRGNTSKYYLMITHIESLNVGDYIKQNPQLEWSVKEQIGENADPEKILNVYEFKAIYDFVIKREKYKKMI